MARHAVRLLATMSACSAFAFALSSGADALEISTPHVNIPTPHINVPMPHINVAKPHINVPTVNLHHDWLSNRTNTFKSVNKLGGGTTPSIGSSASQGSLGIKVITNSVGGSVTKTSPQNDAAVQQQNAAAAAAAALAQQQHQEAAGVATGIAGASSGTGSPGGQNTPALTWDPHLGSPLNVDHPVASVNLKDALIPAYGTAAYYNYLTGGGENAAYAADMQALQAAVDLCEFDGGGPCTAARSALSDFNALMNYLLYLLGLTQDAADTGMNWTAQETALIEQAMTACLNSPSTCAATIANLNAELASLGVPTIFNTGAFGQFQVLSTLAQIESPSYIFWGGPIAAPNNTLSFAVVYWQQGASNEP